MHDKLSLQITRKLHTEKELPRKNRSLCFLPLLYISMKAIRDAKKSVNKHISLCLARRTEEQKANSNGRRKATKTTTAERRRRRKEQGDTTTNKREGVDEAA
ncbi:unnamed protein product [Amoebophrya sp. A120]|nr:unnamed protein product [Amoebophrya sp. A120]|eukprot:GSA120T00010922001.1